MSALNTIRAPWLVGAAAVSATAWLALIVTVDFLIG